MITFYDFAVFAPSPWVAWITAREKGVALERRQLDLFSRENRREPFTSTVSPLGELPAIVLEDGTAITEVVAVCEYLDEIGTGPSLIGANPIERAQTRMWLRRIDQKIAEPMGEGFSAEEGRAFFEGDRADPALTCKTVLPLEAAAVLKAKAREKMIWLDSLFTGETWICGDRYSLADIFLYCFLQFGENHGQPIPPGCTWLQGHFQRMKSRPFAWHGDTQQLPA